MKKAIRKEHSTAQTVLLCLAKRNIQDNETF